VVTDFEVLEENWQIVEMFLRCQTQWRTGMAGVTGFDYVAVFELLKLYQVEETVTVFEGLQLMEAQVLNVLTREAAKK